MFASVLINDTEIRLYSVYFGIEMKKRGNEDEVWVPHVVCKICKRNAESLKFMVPMIWREQKNHHDDYYFCITSLTGINKNNRSKWNYPNISSATRRTPRTDTIPIPLFIRSLRM